MDVTCLECNLNMKSIEGGGAAQVVFECPKCKKKVKVDRMDEWDPY